ncbi:hypothetical protein [Dongia sp.]|uniref:hypothetical protein n=1 Tax=Dongia sp. TaxID=1977262 RepID=UPI00375243C1
MIAKSSKARAVAAALLAFVALLFVAAAPGSAATYTLAYSGQVTSATGMFTTLGVAAGDAVSGSVGLPNLDFYSDFASPSVISHTFSQFPMPNLFEVTHGVSKYSFDIGGAGNVVSQLLGSTSSSLSLTAFGPVTKLSLFYETLTPNAPLFSLAGLTDWGQVPGLFTGSIASLFGSYEVTDLGKVTFSINLAPTPVATTPIPAALPLFVSALGGLGLFGWRRRRGQPSA